jgi:hypothetical protein
VLTRRGVELATETKQVLRFTLAPSNELVSCPELDTIHDM